MPGATDKHGIDVQHDRRRFLVQSSNAILLGLAATAEAALPKEEPGRVRSPEGTGTDSAPKSVRLFLCGDVMTGRGIDQVMRRPCDPRLYERFVKSAQEYVASAEQTSGPIPRRVAPSYVWGDALAEFDRLRPDARILNLETAVTTANEPWPGKGIHYRMHPANAAFLSAANIDCCSLANNHVLDWGHGGLEETLVTLHAAGIRTAGAGADAATASAPAVIALPGGGRILVFAYGSPGSGVPPEWAARGTHAGVNVLDEYQPAAVEQVVHDVRDARRAGDLVIVSIHWGGNWGYGVTREQRRFAHRIIEAANVDVIHGHSSHHPRPIEVHAGKLVLYGCGDFLNDYEGIGGHQDYRPELGFMYLPEIDSASGRLQRLVLVPTGIRRFRVNHASVRDAGWLQETMTRIGRSFGTRLEMTAAGEFELRWEQRGA